MNTINLLQKFVSQRPGLEPCNYISHFRDVEGRRAYFRESREITKDLHDFRELFSLAFRRLGNEFEAKLTAYLTSNSGRLTLENGNLQYITGQYFPTEYRPAANRVLVSLIWNDYRDEKRPDGSEIYPDGNSIRKAIRKQLSQRVGRLYFN